MKRITLNYLYGRPVAVAFSMAMAALPSLAYAADAGMDGSADGSAQSGGAGGVADAAASPNVLLDSGQAPPTPDDAYAVGDNEGSPVGIQPTMTPDNYGCAVSASKADRALPSALRVLGLGLGLALVRSRKSVRTKR